jgi:heat shock protein HslJ
MSQAPAAEVLPAEAGAIPTEALRNATYSGIYDEPITLADGMYEGKPFVEGDASHPMVEYVNGAELYGDLDGDGVQDAVVFLRESSGGSGVFTYVAAQLNRDGQPAAARLPADAGAVVIEDRIGVKSAAIEDGQIVLEIITQGPGDVACCSTHKARRTYALQEGRLVETTPEGGELVQVSAADLDGTSWTLLELGHDQPAVTDSEVTISFQDDQMTGFGGCNNYTGSFSLGEDNPFVMTTGPVLVTQKSCPDPIGSQESAYFAALADVSRWGYVYGKLALYYADGENGESRLLFAPQIGPDADAPVSVPPPTEDLMMLRANPWQWVSFTNPVEAFDIEDPASYRLSFNTDATLGITADCNDVVGFYQGEWGESLTIETGSATLAECGPGSRSDQFVKLLAGGTRYFFEDGNLYIDLLADGGTMVFAPADTEAVAEPDDYVAASSITKNGFAVDGKAMRALDGQEMKIWGFVDHGNLYGDESAKAILEDWWSGEGPTATTWRFNLKASADDAVGHSFEVRVPNDQGRDDLLRAFVADAQAQRPTKVFVKGKMFTFDAPTGGAALTGLQLELASSGDILLVPADDKK